MTAPFLFLPLQNGEAPPTTATQGAPTDPAGAGPTGATETAPSPMFDFRMILVMVAIFWVIVILPQGKERKRRAAMLGGLKKDDNVMTTGGMYGRVAKIDGDIVTLVVADGVRMRFHRQSVQTVLEDERSSEEAPRETART